MPDRGDQTPTDMSEHLRTWRSFTAFFKWHVIGAAIVLLLLLIFRTNA